MELVRSILEGKTELLKDEIWHLSGMMQDYYRESPNVLHIPSTDVIFVGDLHGELQCTLAVQRAIKKYNKHQFVFLGDYGDRGPEQIETFNLVMALTLSNPKRVIMLRGNHESDDVAARYGFYNVVTKAYSFDVFKHYSRVFEVLPIAVYKQAELFACHGGVPEGITSIAEIQRLNRRNPNFQNDVLFQMVWNDPKDSDFTFRPNTRGSRARLFGKAAFTKFMEDIDAQVMFRAHQGFPKGYQTFFDKRLVSVFSSSYRQTVNPAIVRLCKDYTIEPIDLSNM